MDGDTRLEPDQAAGIPQQHGFSHWISRAWGSTNGRRAIVWGAVGVLVLVVVSISIAMFTSITGEPQSYKNGFSSGGTVYSADGTGASPEQACRTAAARPPNFGGVPAGENSTQWIKGCVAGFEGAQSDD